MKEAAKRSRRPPLLNSATLSASAKGFCRFGDPKRRAAVIPIFCPYQPTVRQKQPRRRPFGGRVVSDAMFLPSRTIDTRSAPGNRCLPASSMFQHRLAEEVREKSGITVVQTGYQHTDMSDRGPDNLKSTIEGMLDKFLEDDSSLKPVETKAPPAMTEPGPVALYAPVKN
jgi:hypothetical protein